jgi:hypothetical protein
MISQSRWHSVSNYYIELQTSEHFVIGHFSFLINDKRIKVPFNGLYTKKQNLAFTVEWDQFLNETSAYTAFSGYFNESKNCIVLNWLLCEKNIPFDSNTFINTGSSVLSPEKSQDSTDSDLPHPFTA